MHFMRRYILGLAAAIMAGPGLAVHALGAGEDDVVRPAAAAELPLRLAVSDSFVADTQAPLPPPDTAAPRKAAPPLSLIHISEPTRH